MHYVYLLHFMARLVCYCSKLDAIRNLSSTNTHV